MKKCINKNPYLFFLTESVTQPRRPKQPQLRNVLKYDGTICMWLFRGEIYGRHCGGSIHRISGGLGGSV